MITFRPITREDFRLIGRWLRNPHVGRWWADDSSPRGLEETYGGCVDGTEPAQVFVAAIDDRPLGLVQRFRLASYPECLDEVTRLAPVPRDASSIDYLIGEQADVGRGLGTAMLRAFVRQLLEDDPQTSAIVVAVHASNLASSRVLERVGFQRIGAGEMEPDNPRDTRDHLVYALHRTDGG